MVHYVPIIPSLSPIATMEFGSFVNLEMQLIVFVKIAVFFTGSNYQAVEDKLCKFRWTQKIHHIGNSDKAIGLWLTDCF